MSCGSWRQSLKLARVLDARSLVPLARLASVLAALNLAGPALAGSDPPDVANGTGDDPTQPLGKIELLDRYTEAPGPGVEEGTTKRIQTNTPFARIEAPFRLSPQWELNFRTEIPVVWTNGVTPANPTGATVSGFGNVLTQAWIVHDFDQRWAVALGGQLIAPTSTNGVASDAWEEVTGFVVRAMLPEISPGSYFAPQVRYGIDFEGNDDGRMLRQLRIAPTLNINLPHNLFFTLYPSPDIRLNYGTPVWNQTGRLFLPLNFMLGWKPTEHTVISAEFGIPIIRDFPVYTFKTQLKWAICFSSSSRDRGLRGDEAPQLPPLKFFRERPLSEQGFLCANPPFLAFTACSAPQARAPLGRNPEFTLRHRPRSDGALLLDQAGAWPSIHLQFA